MGLFADSGLALLWRLDESFQFFQPRPQVGVLRARFLELLIQTLDGGQRHAAFVHDGNVFVIRASNPKAA